jgi:hypothetical protein
VVSFTLLSDTWEEVKISTLTGVCKKLIPTFMNDFEGFNISVEEVTTDVVEITTELELEVGPEDGLNYCNLMIKLQRMKSCFLWMSNESGFLRWNLLVVKML